MYENELCNGALLHKTKTGIVGFNARLYERETDKVGSVSGACDGAKS